MTAERAILAAEQAAGAQQHVEPAGVDEVDSERSTTNAPPLSRIAASKRGLEGVAASDVDLAVNGDAGRVAQPGVVAPRTPRCGPSWNLRQVSQ